MAHLAGLIVTEDDVLRKHIGRLLRTGAVPVSVNVTGLIPTCAPWMSRKLAANR